MGTIAARSAETIASPYVDAPVIYAVDSSSTKAAHVAFDDPSDAAPGLRTSVETRFFCLFT